MLERVACKREHENYSIHTYSTSSTSIQVDNINQADHTFRQSETKMELTYFSVRGRGEALNMIAAYAKLPLKQKNVSFDAWADLQPSMPPNKAGGKTVRMWPSLFCFYATDSPVHG